MRLIDADKFEAFTYKYVNDDFDNGVQFVLEMIDKAPTICDIEQSAILLRKLYEEYEHTLEQIRAEILQEQDEWFKETDGWQCYEKTLQIIDKHIGSE